MNKISHQKSGKSAAIATTSNITAITTKTAVQADFAAIKAKATSTVVAHATEPSEGVCGNILGDYSASAHSCMAAAQSKATTRAYAIREGFVFRSVSRHDGIGHTGLTAQSIALLVKASVARSGGDAKHVAGHSLRSGYCTTAAMAGHAAWQIREVTGHKSDVTQAKYFRPVARRSIKSLL